MPFEQYKRFEVDPDSSDVFMRAKHPNLAREVAVRGAEDIDPKYVHNQKPGRYFSRLGGFIKNMPGYVKANPKRFALGATGTAVGLGSVYAGGSHFVNKFRPSQVGTGQVG